MDFEQKGFWVKLAIIIIVLYLIGKVLLWAIGMLLVLSFITLIFSGEVRTHMAQTWREDRGNGKEYAFSMKLFDVLTVGILHLKMEWDLWLLRRERKKNQNGGKE